MTPGWLLAGAGIGFAAGLAAAFSAPRVWTAATCSGAGAALAAALVVVGGGTEWEWRPFGVGRLVGSAGRLVGDWRHELWQLTMDMNCGWGICFD